MGRLQGHRQVTLYIDPALYERARCSAYTLGENIYEFISDALVVAISRRLTASQLKAIDQMAGENIKRGGQRQSRRKSSAMAKG